jgi:hypothetical protein
MGQSGRETDGFTMKVENGIFYCFFDHDLIIDLAIAEKAITKKNQLLKGNQLPTLIDFREVKYFLQGAKDMIFSAEGFFNDQPVAIIVNSFIIQTSINFVMTIRPSLVSCKMCVSTPKAEEWLFKQLESK